MTKVRTRLAGQGPGSRAFYQVGRFVVVGFSRVWNRLSVEGREHVPVEGAFVLAPVHRSNMDTPYAAVATFRRLRYMGKDSLWKSAVSAWLLSALGGFPVSRDTADREALHRCLEILEAGEPLVLFPEGERKSGPVVLPLKDGAAYLAARAGVPIVPVGIGGSERAMGKGARFIRPSKVHVIIGAPLRVEASAEGSKVTSRRAVKDLSDRLHTQLQELFDRAQQRAGA
ncbi:MAG: lysophospholipid acyltransferase family protein [Acidimicrobiales bacterium]